MSQEISQNKRIAKNTVFIYVKLLLTMIIGLYTSRTILCILGVSDYGLLNVTGGVLGMFTFLSAGLGGATTRFINFEMGKKEYGNLNRVFNICLTLHFVIAAVVFLLGETIGVYYIYHYLNVENGRQDDAMFIYQISIVFTCIGIINGPYGGLLNAYEKFFETTVINIISTSITLLIVIALTFVGGDVLRLYVALSTLTSVFSFLAIQYLAHHYWPDTVKLKFVRRDSRYKEIISYSGYNIGSTLSLMARSTGSDLLINLFFGTAVNGAYAVARSVQNYVNTFVSNFDAAAAPQITQAYSGHDANRYNYIIFKVGKFGFLAMLLAYFPLNAELLWILELWLGNVPESTLQFCQCTLLIVLVSSTSGGIAQFINGSGKIKWFKIESSVLFLLCIPVGYILFKQGFPAYSILVLFVIADILQRCIQLVLLKVILNFDVVIYIREVYVRPFVITGIMYFYLFIYSRLPLDGHAFHFWGFVFTFLLTLFFVLYVGLKSNERKVIYDVIKKKVYHG
ncbi:MAG: oligosaccharide flippase family protein [Prevotella sp.]|nr:oligosaccharide flippase family protein [Prevotella sp.]